MSRKVFRRTHLDGHELHPTTQMTAYGYDPSLSEGAVKPPVFLTSTFAFETAEQGAEFFDVVAGRKPAPEGMGAGGLVYSRFNHPNSEIVEDRLALYDGAERALLTSSGMAAISAVALTYLRPGDTVVHYTPLYGGTETLFGKVFPQWGIEPFPFTDGTNEGALTYALEKAARHGPVKMIYLETPANPTNALIDLAMVRRVVDTWADTADALPLIVVDNTMLGPVFQKPIEMGADICVYSLTKYVGGHSDLVAGGITGSRGYLRPVRQTRSAYGFQLDPIRHGCCPARWRLCYCAWSGRLRAGASSPSGWPGTTSSRRASCIPRCLRVMQPPKSMRPSAAVRARLSPLSLPMTGRWRSVF